MQSSDMKKINLVLFAMFCALANGASGAVDLSGTASVNITSETAAGAKNIAFDEARRQIILDVLGQYAMPEQLSAAMQNASGDALTAMIASSSIEGEKLSDTTYSANITMTINPKIAKNWLDANGVQNWIPDGSDVNRFVALVVMSDPIANWSELNKIIRNEKLNFVTKYVQSGQVAIELPASSRANFTIALRENGWRYANQGGVLRVWK